ncbi:amidohydrolase family protein [Mycolicibacterium sp. Dal123E01]|uniref:amidohydrolase family protein n=1 Tax=Mycolicibacterium sp. Dal123E01 TaxID=3457578 RepID=UPI00403ECB5E
MPATSALADHIAGIRLVDNHVHGYWLTPGDRKRFENGLNEANTEPLADFDSGFDTQLGFAVRAHCAPPLGLSKHVDPQGYWERRSELTEDQLARVFLPAAGVSDWLVDTGLPGAIAGLPEMADASGGAVGEIVRLEQVAEQAAAAPGDYVEAFRRTLHERTKTIVLLHCYPYEREAGYLAQAFNNVHLDVGLSINHLGARAEAFIARTLELAPFRKILYSSDAFGPAELHYLGSVLWRAGMAAVLSGFVARGQWSENDAIAVADLPGRDNARRVYRLS